MIPVEGKPHLYRDDIGAIINDDSSGYAAYQQQKSQKAMQRAELDSMKEEISEIKEMLKKITSKL
mgnify:CR=1 FL=1|tara:strand:+ start:1477 stop:1671 length:195 start_codon:yes stop_codon:yes gene_type:complete